MLGAECVALWQEACLTGNEGEGQEEERKGKRKGKEKERGERKGEERS